MTNPRAIELAEATTTWDRAEKANQDIDYFLLAYKSVFSETDILRLERIRATLSAERALGREEGLEEAAEICDNRNESGDTFAAQIRALKTQKQGAKG